jgi:hypothetical protein
VLHRSPDPGVDCRLADSRRWWQALTAPELRLVITCDALEVFQFQRAWWPGSRPQMISHQRHALSGNAQEMLPPEALWQVLHEVLAPLAGQRWHVVVVLSNQYARWLVLPWQAEIRSQSDQFAYYRHGLQQAFASDGQDWRIQAQPGTYGQPTLLNALPAVLLEKLQAVLADYRLPAGIITPAWTLAANQALHTMRQQGLSANGWMVCRESGHLTVACLMQGEWQQIRQLPVDAHWWQTLTQLLSREQVMHPERAALPIFLAQADISGATQQSMLPFQVVESCSRLDKSPQQATQRRMA